MNLLSDRERRVLTHLLTNGASTVDEFLATAPRLYVNSWAPVFTGLRQRGLVERTGTKRLTRHKGEAFVLRINANGRKALRLKAQVSS